MVTEIEPDDDDDDEERVGIDFASALVLGHDPRRNEAYRMTAHP